jgi:diguanylate cyclase (GGDEF)-like protein
MIKDGAESQEALEEPTEESLLLQIQALGQLPSPSHTAMRLFSLLQTGESGLKDIVAVVKSDPTLTVRLLRLANRPGNGAVRPAVAVEEALVRLGLNAAVHLAAGLSVLDEALSNHSGEVSAYLDLCRLSLAAAVTSEWLCGQPGIPAGAAEMFTCALLARVGQLALLRFYPDAYSGFVASTNQVDELVQLERKNFGIDHVAIGTALLNDWGFPAVLVEVIRMAESSLEERAGNERKVVMAQVLHASWEIAPLLVSGATEPLIPVVRTTMAMLGVATSDEDVQRAVVRLQKGWDVWCKEHGFGTPAPEADRETGVMEQVGNAHPVTVVFYAEPCELKPVWIAALEAAGYRIVESGTLEESGRQLTSGHAEILVAMVHRRTLYVHVATLSAMVTGNGHAALLLHNVQDEQEHAELLLLGMDAVLPLEVSPALLCAQVTRAARRIQSYRQLESERSAHRKLLSQLAVTTRKLHRQTLTDPLTGLANRRMADAFLKRHWAQAERRRSPLSCLLIDLDNFKQINDAHGHDAGDRVLQEMSNILKRQVRQEDLAVRLGGDEFLMVCPMASEADMEVLRKRLMTAAAQVTLETGPLVFSTGIAERDPCSMKSPGDLLRAADQKLISVKRGR